MIRKTQRANRTPISANPSGPDERHLLDRLGEPSGKYEADGNRRLAQQLGGLVEAEGAPAVDLQVVVDKAQDAHGHHRPHGQQAAGGELGGPPDEVGDAVGGQRPADDHEAPHRRGALLHDVRLGPVLPDELADALAPEDPDGNRREDQHQ